MGLKTILTDLEDCLKLDTEEGVACADVSPGTLAELSRAPVRREPEVKLPAPAGKAPTAAGLPPETAFEPAAPGSKSGRLAKIASEVAVCTRCGLHKSRTRTVPGQGSPTAELMFVGEGPGADEDREGLAFVGMCGQLLTKMIEAMGFKREEVFIANIVKCRPPGNRTPMPDESSACLPYLKEQIGIIKPKVIVCLGATAVKALLRTETGITKLRGRWMAYEGVEVMPTYHPAYLLRNASAKPDVWEDLKAVVARMGRTLPENPRKTSVPAPQRETHCSD